MSKTKLGYSKNAKGHFRVIVDGQVKEFRSMRHARDHLKKSLPEIDLQENVRSS
tara:strand:- start:44 stop:205 length:162 start_codon:yes stop_codon:yes gene_type:complete